MARMNYRVLLAEPSEEIATALEMLLCNLADLHFEVIRVQTMRETVRALITDHRVDAALIDLHMSDLIIPDSIEELSIKAPRTALVALTSPSGADDLMLLRAGISECLPVTEASPASMARAISHAVERKGVERRLLRLAEHDLLTGIGNRRQLQNRFEVLRAQRARRGGELLGAIFNLDGFSALNESQGLHIGDDTLRRLAMVLLEQVRIEDVVARLGGDEFVVALLDESAVNAELIVHRIHDALVNAVADLPVAVGVSCGGAFAPDDASLRDLLASADHELHDVKVEQPGVVRLRRVVSNGA